MIKAFDYDIYNLVDFGSHPRSIHDALVSAVNAEHSVHGKDWSTCVAEYFGLKYIACSSMDNWGFY